MEPLDAFQSVFIALLFFWMGWHTSALSKMRGLLHRVHDSTKELWDWHKPEQGKQDWKNPGLLECVEELTDEVRGMRADLKEAHSNCARCREELVKLQASMLELQKMRGKQQ